MFALSFYVRNRIHCLVHVLRIIIIFQIFNTILTNLHCLPFSRLKNKNRVALKDCLNYAVTERNAVGLNLLVLFPFLFPKKTNLDLVDTRIFIPLISVEGDEVSLSY